MTSKSSVQSNPVSLAYVVITFLVFAVLIGFILYVQIITVEYVETTQKQCKNIKSTKADMIKTFAYVVMACVFLLLLLQFGQVLQIFQVKTPCSQKK